MPSQLLLFFALGFILFFSCIEPVKTSKKVGAATYKSDEAVNADNQVDQVDQADQKIFNKSGISEGKLCEQSVESLSLHPNKKSLSCFENVESFMAAIDPRMKKHHMLIDDSKSLQNFTSIEEPRIIMYSPNAETIFGISTAENDPNREKVEVAQLNRETGVWDFFPVDFSESDPEKRIGRGDSCSSCHGDSDANRRPIWRAYPNWPGAYSSGNDGDGTECDQSHKFSLSPTEADVLTQIFSNKDSSDRFNHVDLAPPRNGISFETCEAMEIKDNAYKTINTVFTIKLAYAQMRSILKKLEANTNFEKLRPLVALSHSFCKNLHEQSYFQEVEEFYAERFPGKYGTKFEKTQEFIGLDVEGSYKLDFSYQDYEDLDKASTFVNGDDKLDKYVFYHLINDLAEKSPELGRILQPVAKEMAEWRDFSFSTAEDRYELAKVNIRPGLQVLRPFLMENQQSICQVIKNMVVPYKSIP